jgi:hypothetical protein
MDVYIVFPILSVRLTQLDINVILKKYMTIDSILARQENSFVFQLDIPIVPPGLYVPAQNLFTLLQCPEQRDPWMYLPM